MPACANFAELQRKIVGRMRRLGMTPVFPAFAGLVPDALVARYPQVGPMPCYADHLHSKVDTDDRNWCQLGWRALGASVCCGAYRLGLIMHALVLQARYRRLGPWAGFPEGLTSTYMLDPSDPLFTDIGAAFVQACAAWDRVGASLEQRLAKTHVACCTRDLLDLLPPLISCPPALRNCGQSMARIQ